MTKELFSFPNACNTIDDIVHTGQMLKIERCDLTQQIIIQTPYLVLKLPNQWNLNLHYLIDAATECNSQKDDSIIIVPLEGNVRYWFFKLLHLVMEKMGGPRCRF